MRKFLPPLLALFPVAMLHADVTLPPIISHNMVLAYPEATVWGKADPGEVVSVTLGNASAKATATADGRWRVALKGLTPGEAGEMIIEGKNRVTVSNVAVGEVWVASGQSNMTWQLHKVANGQEEIANAKHPGIRMFNIRYSTATPSAQPQEEIPGQWVVCDPSGVKNWSGTGYFFARELHQALGLPVGIIHSSYGGTPVEAWMPKEVIEEDEEASRHVFGAWEEVVAAYPAAKKEYDEKLAKWSEAAKAAEAQGATPPRKPRAPTAPSSPKAPFVLYNTMIHGITPYTVKGFIWYQGEANAVHSHLYRRQLPAMIKTWRERWSAPDAPFYIVQLANYGKAPGPDRWAFMREVQRQIAMEDPASGLAVTIDIGDPGDIHPGNKQEVGRRLALLALDKTYGQKLVSSGPLIEAAERSNGSVTLRFAPGTANGLRTTDGKAPVGFLLAGKDSAYHQATAEITDKGEIILSSPAVPEPISIRYAWMNNPEVNLINEAALPASPFEHHLKP